MTRHGVGRLEGLEDLDEGRVILLAFWNSIAHRYRIAKSTVIP